MPRLVFGHVGCGLPNPAFHLATPWCFPWCLPGVADFPPATALVFPWGKSGQNRTFTWGKPGEIRPEYAARPSSKVVHRDFPDAPPGKSLVFPLGKAGIAAVCIGFPLAGRPAGCFFSPAAGFTFNLLFFASFFFAVRLLVTRGSCDDRHKKRLL